MTSNDQIPLFVVVTDQKGIEVDGPFASRHEARDFIISVLTDQWDDAFPDDEFPYDEKDAMQDLECCMTIHSIPMPVGYGSNKEHM